MKESTQNDFKWKESVVSKDRRYHTVIGKPLYKERFDEVMSFHEPGLAPAKKGNQWFHICQDGIRSYRASFDRAWGFYFGLAAVNKDGTFYHITPDGRPMYELKFSWVGNFQENVCAVRDLEGRYFHIKPDGTRLYTKNYRYVGDFKEGFAAVFDKDGHSFHIDREGESARQNQSSQIAILRRPIEGILVSF